MAKNLLLLKRRIKTAKNISQVARAMEMISASKIKKSQTAVENNRPYAEKITAFTQKIISHIDEKRLTHPYIAKAARDTESKMLIIISTNKGLCGSLNTNLFRTLLSLQLSNTNLLAIGRKIEIFSTKLNNPLIASFSQSTSIPSYSLALEVINLIKAEYIHGKISKVEVLFTKFRSLFSQVPTIQQLLPIERQQTPDGQTSTYMIEPEADKLLADLLPHYLEVRFYQMLLEAYTSEQAARMVAMQNAKNNASDIADALLLAYNKSRQERITNEILSIGSAMQ